MPDWRGSDESEQACDLVVDGFLEMLIDRLQDGTVWDGDDESSRMMMASLHCRQMILSYVGRTMERVFNDPKYDNAFWDLVGGSDRQATLSFVHSVLNGRRLEKALEQLRKKQRAELMMRAAALN